MRLQNFSDTDFQKLVTKCKELPPPKGNYLEKDFIRNLFLTVLDFQMKGTTVNRAIDYFEKNVKKDIASYSELKSLLAKYPNNRDGNSEIANYLWSYNYWNRVELLRRLVIFFEDNGVNTQEKLTEWANKADFKRDFKGKIKGMDLAIFNWLVMRQGVKTVKPDVWVHRFIKDVIGHHLSNESVVEILKNVSQEIGLKAYELDWRIWEYQRKI